MASLKSIDSEMGDSHGLIMRYPRDCVRYVQFSPEPSVAHSGSEKE